MDQALLTLCNMDVSRAANGATTYRFLAAIHTAMERGFMTPYLVTDCHPLNMYKYITNNSSIGMGSFT